MPQNKFKPFIIGAIILLVSVGIAFGTQKTKSSSVSTSTQNNSSSTTTIGKTYTMAEVVVHNSQASCWTTINGTVYDVTSWISAHPGGAEAILGLCGKDGSVAFNDQHGGRRRPEAELATFAIGTLKK